METLAYWGMASCSFNTSGSQTKSVFESPPSDFVQPSGFALYASIVVDALDRAWFAGAGGSLRSKPLISEIVVGRGARHAGCQAIAGVAQRNCHGSLYVC